MSASDNSGQDDQHTHAGDSVTQDSSRTEFNAVDAVHLFNTKIDIAFQKQKVDIVSEIQDKLKSTSNFKGEGNKVQFAFNEDRLRSLETIENKLSLGDIEGTLTLIDSEKKSINYRNKQK